MVHFKASLAFEQSKSTELQIIKKYNSKVSPSCISVTFVFMNKSPPVPALSASESAALAFTSVPTRLEIYHPLSDR